jgi:uncharacterized membrane protein
MAEPVFLYLATYATEGDAEADYDELKTLHREHMVGTYDVAIVSKDEDGKIHVHKREKPTQYGVWGGIVIGAVVSLIFPEVALVVAGMAFGGVAGGLVAHLSSGISRSDAQELGDLIETNEAAIMIVGKEKVSKPLDELLTRAEKHWEGEFGVDRDAFEAELGKAVTEMEQR